MCVLVNKDFPIARDLNKNLVSVPRNISTGEYLLDKEALNHFVKLRDEVLDMGIELLVDAGYRSVEYQEELRKTFTEKYGKKYADRIVAKPGLSEHHTGLALDLTLKIDGNVLDENDELLKYEKYFKMVHSILYKYGFILRYPKGSFHITGYPYEPWHIRYVGYKNALKMKKNNCKTLEEYVFPEIYGKSNMKKIST